LTSSTPILRSPTVGRSSPNNTPAMALPMAASSTRCSASAPIEAPRSSTTDSPLRVGQRAAIAGRLIPTMVRKSIFAIAINARHRDTRLALLHRVGGKPHGGFPASLAQRLAGLVVHLDHDVGMHQTRGRLELRTGIEQRLHSSTVAEQKEFDVGMAAERQFSA